MSGELVGARLAKRIAVGLVGGALVVGLVASPAFSDPLVSHPFDAAVAAKKRCNKIKNKAKRRKCKRKNNGSGGQPGPAATPASLSMSPSFFYYGTVATSTVSNPTVFTVTNIGGSDSAVPVATKGGADAGQFTFLNNSCVAALPAGGSCAVSMAFAPTTTGLKSASLTVAAGGLSLTSSLSGTGGNPASISVTPDTTTPYGPAYTGTTTGSVAFTVTNSGDVPTGVPVTFGFTGTNANASQFAVTDTGTCLAGIPAGLSCTVMVAYAPTTDGPKTSSLQATASPGGSDTSGSLTGTGVTDISISPNPHVFGGHTVGSMTTQTFTVTNMGAVPTTALSAVEKFPPVNADYSIPGGSNFCTGVALAASPGPGNTCTFDVVFNPQAGTVPRNSDQTIRIAATTGGRTSAFLDGNVIP